MNRPLLSKSSYIRSLQCLKSLYLYKYAYGMRDPVPPALQERFDKGHAIGAMAQRLFPGGTDCSPGAPWHQVRAVQRTLDLVGQGRPVLYEAAFMHDRVLAIADIFLLRGGRWIVYEVKSSTSLSETYLEDAALQYHVIANSARACGAELGEFLFLYLNRPVDEALQADPGEIFVEEPVTAWCREREAAVQARIDRAKEVILTKRMPDIAVGEQCTQPYRCDFFGYCHGPAEPD